MKVYELMYELSQCSAGARVFFHRIAASEELPEYEDGLNYIEVDYEISEIVDANSDMVLLDGWAK